MSGTWEEKAMARLSVIVKDALLLADDAVVTRETSPDNVLNWDSLAHVGLMSAVEHEFGVQFTLSELGNVGNVGDLLAALAAHKPQEAHN